MRFFRAIRQRIYAWLIDLGQTRREILIASCFLILLLIIGGFAYSWVEGWPWIDGFYMTFITLTTIGFTEVHALSNAGRLVTVFIGVTGIGIATFVIARFAQLLLVSDRLQRRHMQEQIDRLDDHYIICGYGRVGHRLAEDLFRANRPFVVIDVNEDVIKDEMIDGMLYLAGDAEDDEALRAAGIDRAEGVIVALPDDSSNVFVTLTVRELNPDIYILARTVDHKNRSKLLNAGADKVIAPSEVGADRMAQVILRPNVDQFMENVLHTGALSLQIEEVQVSEGAPLDGETLAGSTFRQQFDAVVIGIIDSDTREMKFHPGPSDLIEAGDILIVIGDREMIRRLRDEGCKPPQRV
jgi:voltage-gated potassium channel